MLRYSLLASLFHWLCQTVGSWDPSRDKNSATSWGSWHKLIESLSGIWGTAASLWLRTLGPITVSTFQSHLPSIAALGWGICRLALVKMPSAGADSPGSRAGLIFVELEELILKNSKSAPRQEWRMYFISMLFYGQRNWATGPSIYSSTLLLDSSHWAPIVCQVLGTQKWISVPKIHSVVGETAISMVIIAVWYELLCQGQDQGEVSEAFI